MKEFHRYDLKYNPSEAITIFGIMYTFIGMDINTLDICPNFLMKASLRHSEILFFNIQIRRAWILNTRKKQKFTLEAFPKVFSLRSIFKIKPEKIRQIMPLGYFKLVSQGACNNAKGFYLI